MIDANLIILGGNSCDNTLWVKEAGERFSVDFRGLYVHNYRHWLSDSSIIDFDFELNSLVGKIQALEPYVFLAKSAGALLVLKGVSSGRFHPEVCVFAGFPPSFGENRGLEMKWLLSNYFVPTIFIQKTNDPVMGAKELKVYLEDNCRSVFEVEEVLGKGHYYSDWPAMEKTLRRAALVF